MFGMISYYCVTLYWDILAMKSLTYSIKMYDRNYTLMVFASWKPPLKHHNSR